MRQDRQTTPRNAEQMAGQGLRRVSYRNTVGFKVLTLYRDELKVLHFFRVLLHQSPCHLSAIYACLVELAEQHAFGLVESVILMGAPVPSDSLSWRKIRAVVSARVVNVYSAEDYILAFLYRSTKLQLGVAGLHTVQDVCGIESVDMSKLVTGHDRYRYLVGTILTKTGFGDVEFNKVAEQERALELMERKKKQVREHVKKHNKDGKKVDPSSQGATEMIVVRDNTSTNSEGVSTPATRPDTERSASFPVQRPRPFVQQRSGQQPQIRRPTTTPAAPGRIAHQPPPPSPPPPPAMDPLSGTIPLASESNTSSTTHQAAFPLLSSRSHRHQQPSNTTPTTTPAPSHHLAFNHASLNYNNQEQGEEQEHDYKIQMRDIDSQKFSPPLEEMLNFPAPAPTSSSSSTLIQDPSLPRLVTADTNPTLVASPVTMTPARSTVPESATVPVREPASSKHAATVSVTSVDVDVDVDGRGYSESEEDEVSSEFGELSMVEPTPLEEGDFGLM